jgi:hypothetical protein
VLPHYTWILGRLEQVINNRNISSSIRKAFEAGREKLRKYYCKTDATLVYAGAVSKSFKIYDKYLHSLLT